MKKLYVLLLLVASTVSFAKQPRNGFLDVAYSDAQDQESLNGYNYRLGFRLSDAMFFKYQRMDLEGSSLSMISDVKATEYGVGFAAPASINSHYFFGVSKVKLSEGDTNTEQKMMYLGYRNRLTSWLEIVAEYNKTKFKNADFRENGHVLGGHFYITDTMAIIVEKRDWRSEDIYTVGFRFASF